MKQLQLSKSLEVTIELSDAVPTDAEIEADLKGLLNMTELSLNTANQLRRVGMHIKRQGMIETQRGALYVTQAWAMGMCRDLYRLAQTKGTPKAGEEVDADAVCKIADCLGKMVGKVAEVSTVLLSQEPAQSNGHTPPPAPIASFPAGANVFGPGSEAHFHGTPTTPAEKTVAKPDDRA